MLSQLSHQGFKTLKTHVERDFSLEQTLKTILQSFQDMDKISDESYEVILLNEAEALIKIVENEELSFLTLIAVPLRNLEDSRVVRCAGNLAKSTGEFLRFNNILLLKKDGISKPESDSILEMVGFWVNSENEKIEFHDRSPLYEELGLDECLTCKKGKRIADKLRRFFKLPIKINQVKVISSTASLSYISERKVGADRCWFCTLIALLVGIVATFLVWGITPPTLKWLGVDSLKVIGRFQSIVILIGFLYTLWRSSFWGFMPYQDVVANVLFKDNQSLKEV